MRGPASQLSHRIAMTQPFAQQGLEIIRRVLDEVEPRLVAVGAGHSEPQLTRSFTADERENIEVAIYFLQEADIVDVLEFHLIRNGSEATSAQELEKWLRTQLAEILNRLT